MRALCTSKFDFTGPEHPLLRTNDRRGTVAFGAPARRRTSAVKNENASGVTGERSGDLEFLSGGPRIFDSAIALWDGVLKPSESTPWDMRPANQE